MKVDVRLANPELKKDDAAFARFVRMLCELAILSNRSFIQSYDVPPLYEAGVRYKNEPQGVPDKLVDIPTLEDRKWGDCLHLTAWRVAELREKGERARVRVTWKIFRKRGRRVRLFHVTVRRGDGRFEDPSRKLGMK